nr:hypothetical protein [Tanacetum cinerariifolium]
MEHVADEPVHKELRDNLMRAVTTASSLEAEQDSGAKKPWGIQLLKLESCTNLQSRVLELEKTKASQDEESLGEDASKQEWIEAIDVDEDITLVNVQANAKMFDANKDLGGEEAKRVVIQELNEFPTTTTTIPKQKSQDKGKGIVVEEPVKPKKKDQIRLDEEAALKLQAEFDEEQRLTRERES